MRVLRDLLRRHKHEWVQVNDRKIYRCSSCGEMVEYRLIENGSNKGWVTHKHEWEMCPSDNGKVRVKCKNCAAIEELELQIFGTKRVWVPVSE
jgi:formate dehydrogenase maturation protein FdhE